jgi:hypothetical protein
MILYAESSAVLRWLFNEPHGDEILRHLRAAQKVTCSRLTLIECRRVIRRALHEQRILEAHAGELVAALAQAAARWAILELSREVADRAEAAYPEEPIRTLDAIHLASALALREPLPELTLLSTDTRVRSNGVRLGFALLPR